MVFLSIVNFVRSRGPDEFWRKRKIFKMSAHFVGRRRNCYSVAIRNVHHALVYATKGRKLKKSDMSELWQTRVESGCAQYGVPYWTFKEALYRQDILLNKKTLSDLAIWEPKSFEAIINIARNYALTNDLPLTRGYSAMEQIYNLEPDKK
ncbi:39S ribosomal protein L20, mitochondrial [Condylostylus longicornis]|uniref:39S ribosomal protein L20, mitochondrial n=1 Tax=Condylostylus longicornis TaxID=2530218 RepID=UPI00244E56FD|nr:39S ribosomal protein L20, mitochondrial [Condylostylus longicornis]